MTQLHSPTDLKQGQSSTSPFPANFAFGKSQRLLNAREFSRVFENAPIRASHPQFLILAKHSDLPQARLGIVVAKKFVKKAVGRNQIKRIARETFRLQQHKIPSIDAIVLARRGADVISAQELNKILTGLWKRIQKRQHNLATAK